MLGSEIVCWLN